MASKKNRTFAVIGLGTFGSQTAIALYRGGANVIAIDSSKSIVEEISDQVTKAVSGDATNEEVLNETGILEADVAIVALGKFFETTVHVTHLLCTHEMKEIFVQVDNHREAGAILALGATDAIFPESDMAERLARQLLFSNISDLLPVGPNLGMIEVEAPQEFVGQSLVDLEIRRKHQVTIVAIRRSVKRRLRLTEEVVEPAPDAKLQKGDILVVLGNPEKLSHFRKAVDEASSREKTKSAEEK